MFLHTSRITLALASLSLALSGCATVPEGPPSPALWRISDKDTTIYLFGTVHALPSDAVWFDGRIADAFNSANELMTEVDTSDGVAVQRELAQSGMLPSGQSLRDMMSAEDREAYEAAMVSLGLPVEALDQYEPWFVAINLSLLPLLQSGYKPNSGVENVLAGKAGSKQREELETVQFQVQLFDGMPMEQQLAYLRSVVDSVPNMVSTLDTMVQEWLQGDVKQLAVLLNSDMTDPGLYDRLIVSRNKAWARKLDQRMDRPGIVFVAVGAGHLAGKGSVQDQLKKLGFRVKRVN